jgi:heterotetrameric sarcosine oxidase gamma subunit
VPENPVARSALIEPGSATRVVDGWEVCAGAPDGDVAVADLSAVAKVLVKAPAVPQVEAALGVRFARAAWVGDHLVTGASPGEWLMLAPVGSADGTVQRYRSLLADATNGLTSVIDLTHGRALMRVSGKAATDLLRRVTAVDLDDRFVPQGSALRTSLARVVTDVVRDDVAGCPSYLLHCERSSGRYLVESLLAAGADLDARLVAGAPPWPDHPSSDLGEGTPNRGEQIHEA